MSKIGFARKVIQAASIAGITIFGFFVAADKANGGNSTWVRVGGLSVSAAAFFGTRRRKDPLLFKPPNSPIPASARETSPRDLSRQASSPTLRMLSDPLSTPLMNLGQLDLGADAFVEEDGYTPPFNATHTIHMPPQPRTGESIFHTMLSESSGTISGPIKPSVPPSDIFSTPIPADYADEVNGADWSRLTPVRITPATGDEKTFAAELAAYIPVTSKVEIRGVMMDLQTRAHLYPDRSIQK